VSPVLPASAAGPGNIAASLLRAPTPARCTRASMADGVAAVLAKLDALIGAISRESGFLEKVLS
jgi:hypothetical protein